LTTSAGGAAGIQFAIQYPNRVKGLILLSSGVPSEKKTRKQITGLMGPPAVLLHDFPIWLSTKYFGFVFSSMLGSDISNSTVYNTMLPVVPRKKGILADENITNIDMNINYDSYPVEKITAPILVVQAKDDPMVKYADVQKFIARTHPKTAVFSTGGHLITGHGDAVSTKIKDFINETK
jgi:pimeloyl-ACP methyl ester carboxylesterase